MSDAHLTSRAPAVPTAPVRPPGSFHDVPGWFFPTDVVLFDRILGAQAGEQRRGDLLEMGAYLGKSAIFMGGHLAPGESFTVCDLFGSEAPDGDNDSEVRGSYATLSRRAFETNYLAFRDELPRVLQAPTSAVPGTVADGSCRFVHIDASHLYEHVRADIAAARSALQPDGIVVLDDYRSEHTPGVACATWQAVLEEGLRPVCVSPNKFYGTWGDPEPLREKLVAALRGRDDCGLSTQDVAGHRLVIVNGRKAQPPRLPASRHRGPDRPAVARPRSGNRGGLRRLAKDWLPPAVHRSLGRGLRAARRRRSLAG
ncbi:class I SAM-dependent methyltransferase [Streptomyces meridianus]|uniref:Class I SAM-dependent methyltransferase n=1 Tax=Streptomyces meridianus TaxID=2938945 RepID=A0ABT0XDT1_9ACTN|nr:class I SAM-dependent methyltransferase [Streptomyces meridianus]MCM2580098.1 class I SAM-dependent methyltransferase [Streptomyces meridianus]